MQEGIIVALIVLVVLLGWLALVGWQRFERERLLRIEERQREAGIRRGTRDALAGYVTVEIRGK